MNCIFCNKKCESYKTNLSNRFQHYKCKYGFLYDVNQQFLSFKTSKYNFVFYLKSDGDTILFNEIFDENGLLSIDLSDAKISNFLNPELLEKKIEDLLIYA